MKQILKTEIFSQAAQFILGPRQVVLTPGVHTTTDTFLLIYQVLKSVFLTSSLPVHGNEWVFSSTSCSYNSIVLFALFSLSFPPRWCLHLTPEGFALMALALETVFRLIYHWQLPPWEYLLPWDPNIPLTGLTTSSFKKLAIPPFPLSIQTAFVILITSARAKEEIKALVAEFHIWRKVSENLGRLIQSLHQN